MILVSYVRKSDLFSGSVNGVHFTDIPADKFVGILHGAVLAEKEDRSVVFETNGNRQEMPKEDVELLLSDPVAIVRRMNPPPIKIDLRPSKSGLVIGYDTLAHGFGERLYCRVSGERLECPGCGRWRITDCPCKLDVEFEEHGKWASVLTEDLLASNKEKFFFPRAWNKGKPWVSREDLEAKYKAFTKERDNV